MIPKDAKLVEHLFDLEKIEQAPTRNGYGDGLVAAADENDQVVALCADLTESTKTNLFRDKYPNRFVEVGIGEQNMASVASGMAAMGKIPYIASYAMFSPGRSWEQVRTTICYNNQNVKIVGAHSGISVGPDGATHQAIEDIAIMRVLPNMTVISPCDSVEAQKATVAAAKHKGPVYIRFHREKTPIFTSEDTPFEIGKAVIFYDPKEVTVAVIATGPIGHNALLAAKNLEEKGIGVRVINCPTIKPLDEKIILKAAKDAGAVVVVEEHQAHGGLGSAVAELLAENYPVPMEFVGVKDRFGESGQLDELFEAFGLTVSDIEKAITSVIDRK
ncbi:MAG: transketolase family protein [bacterium]|nr:transketolase family protein [bacterium]